MAEAERYLQPLLGRVGGLLETHGLGGEPLSLRVTGCPNGCARPYLAEIGLVGRGPDTYNLYLGAAFDGSRLNRLYARDVREAEILALLDPLFARYARERATGEHFGDFLIRTGAIAPTLAGRAFHENPAAAIPLRAAPTTSAVVPV